MQYEKLAAFDPRGGMILVDTSVIADFFIGAHAYVAHLPLLTRDPRRVRTFFPSVRLITP